ncbi:MAG: 6-phosphofructokinase [Deltaproteobacteria bacterium]|nr:6-phosphofructokinase [Deltaproteobacteria bacterium]
MKAKDAIKRIGILTGGGDCPGLNAVIRAVVKTAIFKYGLEVMGFLEGYLGMIKNMTRKLEALDASGILHQGGTILGTSNRDNPFRFPTIVRGKKIFRDVSDQAIRNLKRNKVDALIAVGGDGSLTIAHQFFQKGVPVVGIPKTIDNDLWGTDVTFGFDTALQTAMEAIDKIQTTAASHHRVMVVEVMGRYAGWIALEAGLAGGGDVILIPEIPYDIEKVCEVVRERHRYGRRSSIVVVAEGAAPKKGEIVVHKLVEDSTDPVRLGGIGYRVGNEIEKKTGLETRVTVLGHIQRGGSPTVFDRVLATRLGSKAVDLVMQGRFGKMVCLRGLKIEDIDLKKVQGDQRKVLPNGDLVMTARSIGVSFGV